MGAKSNPLGRLGGAALAIIGAAGVAKAENWRDPWGVDQLRLGVYAHDVDVLNEDAGGVEDGVNVAAEVVLDPIPGADWALKPRPYGQFSWNSAGGTNFGGFGLAWTTPRENRVFGEFGVGYVIHDGVTDLPQPASNPTRLRLAQTRVIFGSRDLFRTTFAVGVKLTARLDAALVFEHLSHGQILATGKNEGLDNLGLRLSYDLDGRRR